MSERKNIVKKTMDKSDTFKLKIKGCCHVASLVLHLHENRWYNTVPLGRSQDCSKWGWGVGELAVILCQSEASH